MTLTEFDRGQLFLGHDNGREIGIETERHAITIAGAGSGKGAAVIIPNLKRWTGNALVIDPKGEAVAEVLKDRRYKQQRVNVLDPFGVCEGFIHAKDVKFNSAEFIFGNWRAQFNPLDAIDPQSDTVKEDIEVITDGLVMRPDAQAAHWDDGAQAVLGGLIAFVLMADEYKEKSLAQVRDILRNDDKLADATDRMKNMTGCAGLCEDAYGTIMAKEGGYFVSNARKNTRWLDSPPMREMLSFSSFKMSDLKRKDADVFLVLPPNRMASHGRFLRLFVRCAIDAMAEQKSGEPLRDRQCLFMLDEFFTLGYIDEIAKAAGLMRGYGLQLWPILQDLGQLRTLYGQHGAETFFGNADVQQFFGNTDFETLDYVSRSFGVFTQDEINIPTPPIKSHWHPHDPLSWFDIFDSQHDKDQKRREGLDLQKTNWQVNEEILSREYQNDMQLAMNKVGKPRLPVDEVRELVSKRDGQAVASKMIVFAKGNDRLQIELAPYFIKHAPKPKPMEKSKSLTWWHENAPKWVHSLRVKYWELVVAHYRRKSSRA